MKKRKREPVPKIRTFDDPVLKKECFPVLLSSETDHIVRGMIQAIKKTKRGVGLAAPQIGIRSRIIVVMVYGFPMVMINPEIEWFSDDKETKTEGCLSYPGVYKEIERSKSVRVVYQDDHRNEQSKICNDLTARIVQHEIDHLNGICKIGV